MRSKLIFASTLAISVLAAPAEADQRGNGGDVVLRNESGAATAQLLDFFEAELLYSMTPNLVGSDVVEMVQNVIDRLRDVDPPRHRRYTRWASEFEAETRGGCAGSLVR